MQDPVPPRNRLDARFEALVARWEGTVVSDPPVGAEAARRRLDALLTAGMHVVLVSDAPAATVDGQLQLRPRGPGRLYLCADRGSAVLEVGDEGPVPVFPTPGVPVSVRRRADVAAFVAAWLAGRGLTGALVLVAGDRLGALAAGEERAEHLIAEALPRCRVVSVGSEPEGVPAGVVHLGGGPARLLSLLDDQADRRRARRVPAVDPDPRWVVPLADDALSIGAVESVGVLANGWAATRGSTEERTPGSAPQFLVAGVYGRHGLVPGPVWTELVAGGGAEVAGGAGWPARVLDLRSGTLYRPGPGIRSLRFVSAVRPHTMALRAEADGAPSVPVGSGRPGPAGREPPLGSHEGPWEARTASADRQIHVAARDRTTDGRPWTTVERIAAWSACTHDGRDEGDGGRDAVEHLGEVDRMGYDALLAEHREEWARRWSDAEVAIDGGPDAADDELASRFAVFNLLVAAADSGESAVGARGLTGAAYAGHVFWDADVFVLPALAAIRPASARAMLEYRIRRLPAARREARARGLAGARFPWESAAEGRDVTPRVARGPGGRRIPILTGLHEEHIVADVAWAAAHYAAWSGDRDLLAGGPGEPLVVDTARYWASRARVDPVGRAHLYGTMGPDEYHEVVDDNAFTNGMARWNLRAGAQALRRQGGPGSEEAARWERLAGALVDGWDPARGVYEQFAGYFGLEDMAVADVAEPPVAIDVLLGHDRVVRTQLIKQPDVLMLHHLLPAEARPGSLGPCLDYYEPRTAHGSSLSPAISASLLARAGRPDEALPLFRLAARLDLDDVTGTTAGGLHLATMGGVWQALAFGFLGLRAEDRWLAVRPSLPRAWRRLSLGVRYRGRRIRVTATADDVTIDCDGPLAVRVADGEVLTCTSPGARFPVVEEGKRRGR